MLPLLQFAADGKEHNLAEARDPLIRVFGLTESDLKELLSSGQSTFGNRVAWAKTYLSQAGLLVTTRRGHFRISPSGRKALKDSPVGIDLKYLARFPEFSHFRALRKKGQAEDRS